MGCLFSNGRIMKINRIITLSAVLVTLLAGCADLKDAGRTIGHATRDVTTTIGHATRDTTKAIGHASKGAVNTIKEDLDDDQE